MKVFNFLCQELSDYLGTPVIGKLRYDLWLDLKEEGIDADHCTGAEAASYLDRFEGTLPPCLRGKLTRGRRDKEWQKLIERIRAFDPNTPTPEEVFTRF